MSISPELVHIISVVVAQAVVEQAEPDERSASAPKGALKQRVIGPFYGTRLSQTTGSRRSQR